jgi:peptide/nickel transport system ATP-binding protein
MAGSGTAHMRNTVDAVLTVRDLTVEFRVGKDKTVKAVSGLSLDVVKGETLAIVGESGCGKTTLARAILQLPPPNSGEVIFDGTDMTLLPKENLRSARTSMQMIFQDPISSLNPRMTVHQLLDEPLEIWDRGTRAERDERINKLLSSVGLEPDLVLNRRSYEFSGGQCQRISIARALALDPRMLICDEPVSALDVSIQAQILNLLLFMKETYGLTMLFISHDLAVVKAISTRVMVMYLGKICEVAPPDVLYSQPAHHYTRALLNSVPIPDPTKQTRTELLQGEPPSSMNPPSGCRFRTRCVGASALCAEQEPHLREVSPGQFVACHHPIL